MSLGRAIQFVLASASPRRKLLLERIGYVFEVAVSGVDESAFDVGGESTAYAMTLAKAKAMDIAARRPKELVLGADTVVDLEGEIIGKPDDAEHAEEITRKLFSQSHKVITGVAMVCIKREIEIVRADTTVVYPQMLTEAQIAGHIESGNWQGKAGAYGIQETGDEFVERIDGSFTNVMGLPMEMVEQLLADLKIFPEK